MAEIYRIAR